MLDCPFSTSMYISGRQISIEFTVSFFLIPKIYKVFFGCPGALWSSNHKKRGWGEPSSLKVFHCRHWKFNSFPSFPEVLPEGTRIPRILSRRWIRKKSEGTLNKNRGTPSTKSKSGVFLFGIFTKYNFDSSGSDGQKDVFVRKYRI